MYSKLFKSVLNVFVILWLIHTKRAVHIREKIYGAKSIVAQKDVYIKCKDCFQLSVFYAYVHARKSFNSSK